MGWAQFAGVLGIVGAAAFLLAFTLSREMVPGEKRLLTPARLFLVSLVPLFLTVFLLFPWESGNNPAPQSWHCFKAGCMFSLPAAGLVVLVLRRGAVLSLGIVGAGAGLLAGLVGVVVLHFGCGIPNMGTEAVEKAAGLFEPRATRSWLGQTRVFVATVASHERTPTPVSFALCPNVRRSQRIRAHPAPDTPGAAG